MSSATTPAPTLVNAPGVGTQPDVDEKKQTTPNDSSSISTEDAPAFAGTSRLRKYFLFSIFCLAQFLDVFNNSALFSAIPAIAGDLQMNTNEASWLLSAYSLTFASLLLVSGRISDVYSPKPVFVIGITLLGVMSIGAGFVQNKVGILVIRAISGIGASLTIPPALNMIVQMFPDEAEQSSAIAIFGGTGAIANVLGLVIGAIFVQYASWRWIFWFLAILAIPAATVCLLLIPPQEGNKKEKANFDFIGVGTLTAALILFIYAITSGSTDGWSSAGVLAPLIISVFLVAGFLFWETRIPEEAAALPPRMWFYPNFGVLFGVALFPYFWWISVFVQFTSMWQEIYHWSAIMSAVHFLPLGVIAGVVSIYASSFPKFISVKLIIVGGLALVTIATVLLPFVDSEEHYWPFAFPAFCIGTFGAMAVYSTTNIAIFATTPSNVAGTVGAVFNAALQLGAAIGIAAITSIQTSVDSKIDQTRPGATHFEGRAAAFWFLLAIVALETIAVAVFYRPARNVGGDEEAAANTIPEVKEQGEKSERVTEESEREITVA